MTPTAVECFLTAGGVTSIELLLFPPPDGADLSLLSMSHGGVAGGVINEQRGVEPVSTEGGLRVYGPGLGGGTELELLSEEAALSLPPYDLAPPVVNFTGADLLRSSLILVSCLGDDAVSILLDTVKWSQESQ